MPRLPDPERRALILRVARQQFARAGFTSTTMADIARAAGMGVGSLYVLSSLDMSCRVHFTQVSESSTASNSIH